MSREFPEHIDELSRYALEEAIGTVSRYAAGGPEEVRRAAAVIRLVTGVPRRVPWYGVPVDPEDNSVTAGVMMRNAFEAVGDWVDALSSGGKTTTKADHWFTKMYLGLWRAGKRDYNDFLDHLTDPLRWEAEQAERRLSAEQAAQAYAQITEISRQVRRYDGRW
jgi:hypothetical protein